MDVKNGCCRYVCNLITLFKEMKLSLKNLSKTLFVTLHMIKSDIFSYSEDSGYTSGF